MAEPPAPKSTPDAARALLAGITPAGPVEVGGFELLRTGRMHLRPLVESDRGEYLRAVRNSAASLDAFMPLLRAGETEDQMFDRQLAAMRVEGAAGKCFRTVGVLQDGRIAGGFNLNAISRGLELRADITWWIATDLCGRGLATEGVAALLAYALADMPRGLGLHTVWAWITDDNPASIRVAQRVGLTRQAQERSFIDTGNRWALHQLYARRVDDPPPA